MTARQARWARDAGYVTLGIALGCVLIRFRMLICAAIVAWGAL